MNTTSSKITYPFLQGGGEMGERTRNFNWSQTPLGSPEQWPQSLRTTVAMILTSRFPMFLWWGDDMIQFYNDAYRPSMGKEGKHPRALGAKAIDTWPEIWDIIYPLIHQVKTTGVATWNEDQLVPIYRNGKLEDVYWTFGYSPILGDSDSIEGVLVVCTETTQKVQHVQKLEESDRRFRNLIHNAPVGIIVLSGAGMVVEIVNDFYGRLINRTADELLHRELFSVIPETEEHFRPILENVRTSGIPVYLYDYPYFIFVDDKKREGYLNLVYHPYKDHDGKIIGIIALCHDVTEQVLTRKKIEESEHRYRTLIEATSVATALYIGRELRIQYVNDIMTGYWGKDTSVIGRLLKDAVPELVGQSFLNILDQVYETGESYVGREEKADLIVDGVLKPFYFNFTYKALRNKEGEIYGIHHMAMDVTPQFQAKQALEESERNFRNLVMQAPVAIAVFRGEEFVTEVANDSYLEIVGKTRTEFVGIPLFTAIPEARALLEPLARELVRTGIAFPAREFEIQLVRNGALQTCYFNSIWEPLREINGRVNGFTVVAHEVTDQVLARKKIEEIVAQRTEELAAANEALVKSNQELTRSNINLEEFAYAASHDLKEPVRKIHFFGDRLKNSLSDRMSDEERRTFERMESASKRMSSLIDDLLSYSQVSLRPRKFESVDMNKLIELVLADLDLEIEEKNAEIIVNPCLTIQGHHRQLQQAFQNLIGNALKYSRPESKPRIEITCSRVWGKETDLTLTSEEQQKEYCRINIIDKGIGFEQKDADRIFNVFTRLHGNTEYRGTGVGLSIVRKVAEHHNGFVKAYSEINKGSTFQVFLPV